MLYAIVVILLVLAAVVAVAALGPLPGIVAWLLLYGAVRLVGRLMVAAGDPAAIYDAERRATTRRDS